MLDCDVLIVGAGPTGLTLGLLLARRGLSVIIAEREQAPYPLPRAAHIDHQTVRIFQALGLAQRIVAGCQHPARYDFLSANGEVLMRFDGLDRIAAGGWPTANAIHQPSIERALLDALADQAGCSLRYGWRFVEQHNHADLVTARFETGAGSVSLRARYLVGADGARSPVREAISGEMEELGQGESWLILDALVLDRSRLPDINLQICDPRRPTTCVVMGEGRHRWEFMLKPGETPEALLEDRMIAALLAPWNVDGAIKLERKAVYRFSARIAREWRKGAVLLAGDAAHLTPPFAGQGMCSGLRDAANLAWKLAAIVRDGASDNLLDTYQPEREPHARSTIALALLMGSTVCVTDFAAAETRDAQWRAQRAAGSSIDASVSPFHDLRAGCLLAGTPGAGEYFPQPTAAGLYLDDVLGSDAWLISRAPSPEGVLAGLPVFTLADPALAAFVPALTEWLDSHAAEAVLVRADRYVFGTGAGNALISAFRAQLGLVRTHRRH